MQKSSHFRVLLNWVGILTFVWSSLGIHAQSASPSANSRDQVAEQMTEAAGSTIDFGISFAAEETDHVVLLEKYSKATDSRVRLAFTNVKLGEFLTAQGFMAMVITDGQQYWTATPCKEGFCQPSGPTDKQTAYERVLHSIQEAKLAGPESPARESDESKLKLVNLQARLSAMPMENLSSALQRLITIAREKQNTAGDEKISEYLASESANTSRRIHELLASFPAYRFDESKYRLPANLVTFTSATAEMREKWLTDTITRLSADLDPVPSLNSLSLDDTSFRIVRSAADKDDYRRIASTFEENDRGHAYLNKLKNQLAESVAAVRSLADKGQYCEGDGCVTVTVLQARLVVITDTDANGYEHHKSGPLQRAVVAVGGYAKGDGIMLNGRVFEGHGSTADLLCLQNCVNLTVGGIYRMRLGRIQTHMRRCFAVYGDCWDYDNLPYLSIDRENGKAAWQILELCSPGPGERCLQLSTVNSRE